MNNTQNQKIAQVTDKTLIVYVARIINLFFFKYRGDVIHGIVLLSFYDAIHLYLQDLPDKTAVHFQEGAGNQSFIDSFLLPPVGSFKYANLNGLYYLLTAAG